MIFMKNLVAVLFYFYFCNKNKKYTSNNSDEQLWM